MFRKPGDGTFLGRENVPNEVPGYVREDSPRQTWTRNTQVEQNADEVIRKLRGKVVVRDASGNTFEVVGHAGMKEGWTLIGRVDPSLKPHTHVIMVEHERPACVGWPGSPQRQHRIAVAVEATCIAKGWQTLGPCMRGRETSVENIDAPCGDWTMRGQLQHELDAQAQTLKVSPYRTGRRLNMLSEGEGIIDEVVDDRSMAERVHPRGTTTPKIEGKP